jgi:hypothetical protein
MALTQITIDQVKDLFSKDYINIRNNSGITINAFKFVKINADYSAGEIPSVLPISSISDEPVAFLLDNLLNATNTAHPSSTSKAILSGRVQVTGFDTSASSIGTPIYFNSSGDLTLTPGSQPVGIVLGLDTNGIVYIDLNHRFKYIKVLSSSPLFPRNGETYYNTSINQIVYYDSVRNKWLSDASFNIHVGRNGNLAPGSSFRFTDSLPTSTTPILLERNCTLVGIVASTSAAERFVIRVDDVSGGSGTQTAINYEAPGPAATTNFIDLTLNADYNANDRLDIYVLSSNTGNISNPLVKLIFRYRV